MARTALGWGVRDLAKAAKIAPATVTRFESGRGVQSRSIDAIRTALETSGIILIHENGGGPGVRLQSKIKNVDGLW